MLPTNTPAALAIAVALVGASVFLIAVLGLRLARRHPSDVRIVCYFFSLTVVLTVLVAMWANAAGAIDGDGTFHGRIGSVLNRLLRTLLDVDASLKLLGGLVGVVVLPQVASYVLGGLFGCGTSPILVGRTLQFFVWSLAKSLVVASGMLMALAGLGAGAGWKGWSFTGAASMVSTGMVLSAMTFVVLHLYRFEFSDASRGGTPSHGRGRARMRLVSAHAWLTRNVSGRSKEGGDAVAPSTEK
ncbi:hypothetical protein [Variovorax sp. J22R115]|uniref:hypothetical protein n=1 Tax=Variovorax sp. J22R115 TaxID=3053509 RepID=UPI00257551CD|nr:hypothetical protein [Variovorax sp. J22R115]MDM0053825.1 hypothetical protein [Variovorax sp. J22R115]